MRLHAFLESTSAASGARWNGWTARGIHAPQAARWVYGWIATILLLLPPPPWPLLRACRCCRCRCRCCWNATDQRRLFVLHTHRRGRVPTAEEHHTKTSCGKRSAASGQGSQGKPGPGRTPSSCGTCHACELDWHYDRAIADLTECRKLFDVFETLFGEPAVTFDNKWMRVRARTPSIFRTSQTKLGKPFRKLTSMHGAENGTWGALGVPHGPHICGSR